MPTFFAEARQSLEDSIRKTVDLDFANESGETKRQSLLSAKRQLSKLGKSTTDIDAQLAPVEVGAGVSWLLGVFWALHRCRRSNHNGYAPISFQEIKAYCDLMQDYLTPWDVATIIAIDKAFLEEVNSRK